MAKKIYPSNDAEFAIWLANLINKATIHKAILKLTDEQLTDLENQLTFFSTNLALKQQKKEESVGQTALVKDTRKNLNKNVGLLNNAIKSIDGVPSSVIEEMGLNVNDSSYTNTTPAKPLSLVVTGSSDGVNLLKFDRNNNHQGTMFIIEAKIGDSNNWVMIDAITGSTYKHKNQIPGVKIQYRVKAKRGELESVYSNTAVVYG